MESDSAMDSDSDAEAPEKRIMSYMYLFEAKINYNNRNWDATTYMRRYLDLRRYRYKLKQPELIAFAAIDQEPPDDDTANTSNKSLSVTGIICGYGIRNAAVLKYLDDSFEVFPIPSGCSDIPRQFTGNSETSRDLL